MYACIFENYSIFIQTCDFIFDGLTDVSNAAAFIFTLFY